jgi:hypothetical protein
MSGLTLNEMMTSDLYLAGERVPAGIYREVESGREVRLEVEGYLPATLDGRVAAYVSLTYTWGQMQNAATGAVEVQIVGNEAQAKVVTAGGAR